MTLLTPAVRPYLVFGPVPAAAYKPVLAAAADGAVPDLLFPITFVHGTK